MFLKGCQLSVPLLSTYCLRLVNILYDRKFVIGYLSSLSLHQKKNQKIKRCMTKKNVSIILIALLTLLLLAFVIWMFDKKIAGIEKKIKNPVTHVTPELTLNIRI
jgi:hypothetical protein